MDVSTPTTNHSTQESRAEGGLAKDMISEPTSAGSIHGISQTSGIAEARPSRAPAHSASALDPFATTNSGYQANGIASSVAIDNTYDDGRLSNTAQFTNNAKNNTSANNTHQNVSASTHKAYNTSASKAAIASAAAAAQAAAHASDLPTMGQMADAVQATARMASRNGGVRSNSITSDVANSGWEMGEDDGGDGTGDADLCQPGSEHTGRWTRKEHELFLDALKKYGKVRIIIILPCLPASTSLIALLRYLCLCPCTFDPSTHTR